MTPDREALLAACLDRLDDDAPWGAYADFLHEAGDYAEEALVRERLTWPVTSEGLNLWEDDPARLVRMLPMLEDYDWRQAFGCAGEPGVELVGGPTRAAPTLTTDPSPFTRAHVALVVASRDGERDEKNWVCVGRLWDGRWFVVDAGCDYTGWG
jgi:uncharacterized protein (TIGR02996 family)